MGAAKALTGVDDHFRMCRCAVTMAAERTRAVCTESRAALARSGAPEQTGATAARTRSTDRSVLGFHGAESPPMGMGRAAPSTDRLMLAWCKSGVARSRTYARA